VRREKAEEKAYFVVKPLLNHHNLGYEPVDVLLETNDLEGVLRLEDIATRHPYTAYRSRCYGAINGELLQFRAPIGTRPLIEEMVKQISDEGVVTGYRFLPEEDEPTVYTSLRIDGWDSKTLTWKFDWDAWFTAETIVDEPVEREEWPGKSLSWLTRNDLCILQELMKGARRKNSDLIETLRKNGTSFTPQTFSRRYRMIRNECIDGFRVTFDPSAFDIYTNILILGTGGSAFLQRLRTKMVRNPIPFESTMRVSGNQLFWYIRLQPSHLSPVLTNLFSSLKQMTVCLLDYTHSYLYYVWPETLDENTHSWRTERQFMIDDVLRSTKQR